MNTLSSRAARSNRYLLAFALTLTAPTAWAQDGNARAAAIAARSKTTQEAARFLRQQAGRISNPAIATATKALPDNPAPTFMAAWPDLPSRERIRQQLASLHLVDASVRPGALFPPLADPTRSPQPFTSAPGGTPDTRHAHPGGLAEHAAFNLQAALDLAANYRRRYGIQLDLDLVIAAPIWHDAMKPWCLQWREDGTMTVQASLAGTASHHIFAIAEALHRMMPPELVVAIAFAHEPATEAARVRFLRAGALLAGVDPVERRLLTFGDDHEWRLARRPSIEANIDHLADHDYVIADPAGREVADALVRLARAEPGGADRSDADLRWMRHRIRASVPHLVLYQVLRRDGDPGVVAELARRKVALVDPSDHTEPSARWIALPAGAHWVGCGEGDAACEPFEKPARRVSIGPLLFDRTEVTAADYAACVKSGACDDAETSGPTCNYGQARREQHPMNCLDHTQASNYCAAQGARLPTADEWEAAARGGDRRIYVWGNDDPPPPKAGNFADASEGGSRGTGLPCQTGDRTATGICDLAGNVHEWTSTRAKEAGDERYVVKGGAFDTSGAKLRISLRSTGDATDRSPALGLRCVRER